MPTNKLSIEEMVAQIDTTVDPDFVYAFQKTKFVPSDGKTLLIMGQTVEGITEYLDHFSKETIPGGWAAYWAVTEFNGVTETHTNETNSSQNHQMLVDQFPNTVLQSALWMVGKLDIDKNVSHGKYDSVLQQYSTWAKSINRPIYLRIGYEFDGMHNELEPEIYIKAYQYIVDFLRNDGVENIAFVWHSYASKPYKDYPASNWYPGDEYVDWVGISVFGHAYDDPNFGNYCDAVMEHAKVYKKPVMIAEANPIKGIEPKSDAAWTDWFVNFFSFCYEKNIKAISLINENWQRLHIDGIGEWKDGRLHNNPNVAKAWFLETDKERYLKQSETLFKELGYE
ncbi:beta-1,3-xylanase XYL4 [Kordia sp. SMS9]|uniref:glycosyl hydrolase n=1 Tax=Kordia sp. SMS9 TaxID=2282170 RepID=UPI000E0E08C8|nr:glycosyl hydrolase [Kordia sp. SMS9]AXG67922.1 beta-1,3-xylanase XYL4 [Kordia sp. SMS9]